MRETIYNGKTDVYGNMLAPQTEVLINPGGVKNVPTAYLTNGRFSFARRLKHDKNGKYFQYENVKYYLDTSPKGFSEKAVQRLRSFSERLGGS